MSDDILVSKQFIENILSKINEIVKISNSTSVNEKLIEIKDYIQGNMTIIEHDSEELANLIKIKMKEIKNIDPDLETRYYMLHQDLVNNRITQEKAQDLYKVYSKLQEFEKKIY